MLILIGQTQLTTEILDYRKPRQAWTREFLVPGYNTDFFGNPVPQGLAPDRGAYETILSDNIAPTLNFAEITSPTTVLLTFSEQVSSSTAQLTANYSITSGIGVVSAELQIGGSKVVLTTGVHPPGSFTVTASNIKDLAGNLISGSNSAQYNYNPDLTPPQALQAQLQNNATLSIIFSEALEAASALSISNYTINNDIMVNGASLPPIIQQ